MIIILWWCSVGLPLATAVYYIDLLEASYVEKPFFSILMMGLLWPITLWMVVYGAYTHYQWRKQKGDII